MQKQLLNSEIRTDNWIIAKCLILTKVDFNRLPKAQIHSTLPYLSFMLNFPTQSGELWLCLKELMKATSPPALSTAEQFHRHKSILLILEFLKCSIFGFVALVLVFERICKL